MHNMALAINHYIAVMTIFNLQNIASHGVCRHGVNEVQSCFLEGNAVLSTVFRSEKSKQIVNLGATHLVSRCRVRDHINNTTLRQCKAELRRIWKVLTPGAVAVTRYGKRYRLRPTLVKIFLNMAMTCKARTS